jgi:serine/threonine-protein kinase
MNQSQHAPTGAPDPAGSRDEVRRRFLAQVEASARGGPPPNVESFVTPFPEPERSRLRAELEALWRICRDRGPLAGTTKPQLGATTGHTPAAATRPGSTVDYVPAPQDVADVVDTDLGETSSAVPRGEPATEGPDSKTKRSAVPQTVASYEVISVLGRGGMGIVYKARQRGLKRLVALKMILSGGHASEQELARFRAEAEAVARLQHPNIVQIYEVGEEKGLPFFSLEFVDGSNLNKKIAGTPLPPREAAALLQKLAEAMHYAHEHGIIHRDLKPSNVLLTRDGAPKVGDFGLAKQLDNAGQTQSGAVMGTPSYMAPEQASGKTKEIGPGTDVYALGATLYECLTGRPPFRASTTPETLHQVVSEEPVPPARLNPATPRDLETICLMCLQKDRTKRYDSAADLAEDLRRFQAGEPIKARPVGPAERLWRWCKRNPRVAALSGAAAALIVGWAVSASALAWGLKLQTDIAHENEKKAKDNEEQAIKSADYARTQKDIAQQNEKRAKDTAGATVEQMIDLGKAMESRLQSKRLALDASPEMRGLREQLIGLLQQSLIRLGKTIEGYRTTSYATAATCQALGDLLLAMGQTEEARQKYQQGYEDMKKLADADPDNDQTVANLAIMIQRLGDVPLEAEGDPRRALAHFAEERDLNEAVLKRPGRQRAELQCKKEVSHADVRMGRALLALGQPAVARKYLEEARAYRQNWVDTEPRNSQASSYLMEAEHWLGVAAAHLGDEKAARDHFGAAIRRGADLIKDNPDPQGDYKGDMAVSQGAYGDALLRFGKAEEAEKSYEESMRYLKLNIAAVPDDIKLEPLLAMAHERLATASAALGKQPAAEQHYQEALGLRKALSQIEPTNLVRGAAYQLALARCGKYDEAAAGAGKLLPGAAKDKKTVLLLDVARCYATCATGDGPKKPDYTRQALQALNEVVTQKDYKDAFVLETDPDLAAVRGEPAFKVLVDEVKGR